MKQLSGKVAVVSGAGSGIGRALALYLAESGCALAINDINQDYLAETEQQIKVSGVEVLGQQVDVGERKEVEAFALQVVNHFGHVDIVINNAGIALGKVSAEELTHTDFEQIMQVNFWGMVYGSRSFLPYLKLRPEAALVNVSSLFGIVGIAHQAAYCSSKFAIRGYTESLRMEALELYPNLLVSSVHPGGIQTNIAKNSKWVGNVSESERKQLVADFEEFFITSAEQAAKTIVKGIRRKKGRILIGRDAKFLDLLARLFPTWYIRIIGRQIKRRMEKQNASK